jgi:hypothetical protein
MLGPDIQVAAVCLESGLRVDQIAKLQLAYPTMAQALFLAAERLARDLGFVRAQSAWDPVEMRPVCVTVADAECLRRSLEPRIS